MKHQKNLIQAPMAELLYKDTRSRVLGRVEVEGALTSRYDTLRDEGEKNEIA